MGPILTSVFLWDSSLFYYEKKTERSIQPAPRIHRHARFTAMEVFRRRMEVDAAWECAEARKKLKIEKLEKLEAEYRKRLETSQARAYYYNVLWAHRCEWFALLPPHRLRAVKAAERRAARGQLRSLCSCNRYQCDLCFDPESSGDEW